MRSASPIGGTRSTRPTLRVGRGSVADVDHEGAVVGDVEQGVERLAAGAMRRASGVPDELDGDVPAFVVDGLGAVRLRRDEVIETAFHGPTLGEGDAEVAADHAVALAGEASPKSPFAAGLEVASIEEGEQVGLLEGQVGRDFAGKLDAFILAAQRAPEADVSPAGLGPTQLGAELVQVRAGVVVVVHQVERESALPSAANRPAKQTAGEENLTVRGVAFALDLVAGEIALDAPQAELVADAPGAARARRRD